MDTKINEICSIKPFIKVLHVCAYARVSSLKDAMHNSLSNQVSYYNKLIQSHVNWQFAGVYVDEGISGTKEDRKEFNQMIEDARNGYIDMIITKSVSRFARNTVTLLQVLRELKELQVNVYFEEQNINSLSADGELMLTILASYAQEEARSVSENMKWRVKKNYEQGLMMGYSDSYGYRVVDKNYKIVKEEAKVVRQIFDLYINGKGIVAITNYLNDRGIKPLRANKWSKTSINQMLTNVIYIGDLVLQKYYNSDYITKRTILNKGELPQYYVEGHHEGIVDKEVFLKAQEIRKERIKKHNIKVGSKRKTHLFTHKIKCGKCGAYFHLKATKYNEKWVCSTSNSYGKKYCNNSKAIPESELIKVIKDYLGISELTPELVNKEIDFIVALSENTLELHLNNGKVAKLNWKDKSRKDSWTPEMKEKARIKTLENLKKVGESNA